MPLPPRNTFRPTPGTERCRLCRELLDGDHVRHPWPDVLVAAWRSSWMWRVWLSLAALLALLSLTSLFAAIRQSLGG